MKLLADLFTPNKIVARKTSLTIIVAWVVLMFAFWIFATIPIIPKPLEVARAYGPLWMQEGLSQHAKISLVTNIEALIISIVISLSLAYLSTLPALRPLTVALTKGRFLGLVGLTFLFTLMTTTGHQLKLCLLVFGISVFLTTSATAVVAAVPKEEFDYARTLRMGEWRVLWEMVVLGKADEMFEIIIQNAAIGWMMLTMVEGLVKSEGGLGALILNQNKHFYLAQVFAIQLMILFSGLLMDYTGAWLKNYLFPYAKLERERK